jgi:hypothetical protein
MELSEFLKKSVHLIGYSMINWCSLHQATSANLLCRYFLWQHDTNSRGFPQQNGMRNLQPVQGTACFVALCSQEFAVRVP